MINFPTNPTENQIFNFNGKSYQYISGRWISLVTHMLVNGPLEARLQALEARLLASEAHLQASETRLQASETRLQASEAKIAARIGTIFFVADYASPRGSLICDGRLLSRTYYADLFAKIGTTYGGGDGSTTFQLPDYRGEFLRGWDGGRGVDAGRVRGSFQEDQNKALTHSGTTGADSHTHTWFGTTSSNTHSHSYTLKGNVIAVQSTGSASASTWYSTTTATTSSDSHSHTVSGTTDSSSHSHTFTTAWSGGGEVRVRNKAELICIWFA